VGGRAYTAGSEAKIRRRRFTRRRRVARRQRCAPICLTDRNEGDHEAEDEEDGGGAQRHEDGPMSRVDANSAATL
jgi:hypothetical protein